MKKVLTLLAFILSTGVAISQQGPENTYVLEDGLIVATLYHESGTKAQEGYYTIDNKLHGKWISYDEQGVIQAIAHYDRGQKVGKWSFYHGDYLKEVTYQESRIAEVKTWKMQDSRIVAY